MLLADIRKKSFKDYQSLTVGANRNILRLRNFLRRRKLLRLTYTEKMG